MFCGVEPFVQILVEDIKSNNSVKLFKFDQVVQEQMLFKDISYLELWLPFCSAEQNNLCLCNFGRGYPEEQFYKNYFEFGPVVQEEITLERFLILSSGSHPVQWSRTIYAIFVKSSVRNNSVNLFCIWTSGSGGDVV